MRVAGLALVLAGLILFVLPQYAQYASFLRNMHAGDLRVWGALLLAAGAIALALSRRSE
jgi:uncharacterized protein YjeT (DUF2065 family)